MSTKAKVKAALPELIVSDKAEQLPRFFKVSKGQYGEGDKFMGVTMLDQRKVAKRFTDLNRKELSKLLEDPIQEIREVAADHAPLRD